MNTEDQHKQLIDDILLDKTDNIYSVLSRLYDEDHIECPKSRMKYTQRTLDKVFLKYLIESADEVLSKGKLKKICNCKKN